jgi:hypothetical protein
MSTPHHFSSGYQNNETTRSDQSASASFASPQQNSRDGRDFRHQKDSGNKRTNNRGGAHATKPVPKVIERDPGKIILSG